MTTKAGEQPTITQAQYKSAVKGRQDFRNAYRNLLPVLRAAEELSRLWRTKGQRVDVTEYWDAINAIDVAVTGGGAKPDPEHLTRTTSLAAQELVDCERCCGNGEVVTDWERYMHPHDGDVGDEAVADCPDCDGNGKIEVPSLAAQDGLVEALELAFDFACKVNALLTPLKSEWQDVNMWTEYDEGVFQMRPKVTLALQAALSAIKGDKS